MERSGRINRQIEGLPGIHVIPRDERVTRRSHHAYLVRYAAAENGGLSRDDLIWALNAEGALCWHGYDRPLYTKPLFRHAGEGPSHCPLSCPYYGRTRTYDDVVCPNAERLCTETVWMPHKVLLGTDEDADDIARAFHKVYEHRSELPTG